jgi:hypothetical protein
MAGNQPIVQRDNPLARKLAVIDHINETEGIRATGGGAEIIPAPAGATVELPEPVPVSAEEEARLQAAYDQQWGNTPAAQIAQADKARYVESHPRARVVPGIGAVPEGFAAIDLVNSQVVATNGAVYSIEEAEKKELLGFAFRVMLRAMNAEIARVAAAIGIETQAPPAQEAGGEDVSEVSGDQTEGGNQQ